MARNTGSLLTLALLACAAYLLLPSAEPGAFVAPEAGASLRGGAGPAALARGYQPEARSMDAATMAAGDAPSPPGKINLLFLAVLVGTAAIGLVSLFAYGAYSGAGSAI